MSREHFCVDGSSPAFVGDSLRAVEAAVRGRVTSYRPAAVIAGKNGGTWTMLYFVEARRLRRIDPKQAVKYEGVRAGTTRWSSTMRARPPDSETSTPSAIVD